jgi:hypothetical protein
VDGETARHLTPMGFEHINFDGVLSFSLEQHRVRILPSSQPPTAWNGNSAAGSPAALPHLHLLHCGT